MTQRPELGCVLWSVYQGPVRFTPFFKTAQTVQDVDLFKPKSGDVVMFHGGADIWPGLYGQAPIKECQTRNLLVRDILERKVMEVALENNIPMVGICRGAQHLCVFSGGTLIQDIDGHRTDHGLMSEEKGFETMEATPQDHHQMMVPFTAPLWEPLAWTKNTLHTKSAMPEGVVLEDWMENWEVELVWFPHTRALCIQPHPEWRNNRPAYEKFQTYCDIVFERYMFDS